MNEKNIKCFCGNEYTENDFKAHFKKCELYINNFKELDLLIIKYLKNYDSLLVRFLLKRYIKLIESKYIKNESDSQNNINLNNNNNKNINNDNIKNNNHYLNPNIKKIDYMININSIPKEKSNKNINISLDNLKIEKKNNISFRNKYLNLNDNINISYIIEFKIYFENKSKKIPLLKFENKIEYNLLQYKHFFTGSCITEEEYKIILESSRDICQNNNQSNEEITNNLIQKLNEKRINNFFIFISDMNENIGIKGNINNSFINIEMNEFDFKIILNKLERLVIFSLINKKFFILCG